MTAPRLYDINETAERTHLSVSWLYHNAGKTIPVTRPGGTKKLRWTDEQIEQIIRDGAQPPKGAAGRKKPKPRQAPESKPAPKPQVSGVRIPQARPERSRLYRPSAATP